MIEVTVELEPNLAACSNGDGLRGWRRADIAAHISRVNGCVWNGRVVLRTADGGRRCLGSSDQGGPDVCVGGWGLERQVCGRGMKRRTVSRSALRKDAESGDAGELHFCDVWVR